jgi:large subunit ribosomal protein L15
MTMELGNLKKTPGSNRKNKRVGRGQGSGIGRTAGRGTKGQRSRSGSKKRAWFEGGQMPLQRRLPKIGFYSHRKKTYQIVNLKDLERLGDTDDISPESLKTAGLVKYTDRPVKILGDGKIEKKYNVKVHAISKSARGQVEKLGGSVTLI